MEKIDLKDRKILYHLDLNCRQSNTQIGKKVGLSKQVVDYRIKRMEDEGIITSYWTLINSFVLGFDVYRYYITFQNATQKIKEEMINFLIQYKNTWTVYSASGFFDLGILIWVRNLQKFNNFWEEFNDKYGDYILEKIFSVVLKANSYRHTFLISDDFDVSERKKYIQIGPGPLVKIDKLDYEILNVLVLHARKAVIEIAEQLGCSSQTVNYRIKNLIEKGIIQSFKVSINSSKIGLQQSCIDLWLRKLSKRKEIWRYLENNPNITYMQTNAGFADLENELIVNGLDSLERIMEDLSEKFTGYIRKYSFFIFKNQYIIRSLPDMNFK